MLSAEIWHWWIGVLLTIVTLIAVIALVGGYTKQVTSQQYPGKRQRRGDEE